MLFAHVGNVQISIKGKPLRTSRSQIFFKIAVLKNFAIFSRKTCVAEYLFNKVAGMKVCIFIKKETPAQLFSCEYCEIFKNNFFYKTPPVHYTFPKLYVDDRIVWTSLGAKLTFFIFLVSFLCFPS